MSKLSKAIKVVALVISFGFIGLSGIEVVSGLLGDISLFGFNLTEAQQQITHYVASGGLAITGGIGITINELLNKKLRESREITNLTLDKFLTLADEYKALKTETNAVRKDIVLFKENVSNEIFNLTSDIKNLVELTRVELETKLSNPLIDKTTKELIERALNDGNEE